MKGGLKSEHGCGVEKGYERWLENKPAREDVCGAFIGGDWAVVLCRTFSLMFSRPPFHITFAPMSPDVQQL